MSTLRLLIGVLTASTCGLTLVATVPALRMDVNERLVVWDLRRIAERQAEFKHGVKCDRDSDGMGEYGFLGEIGAYTIRDGVYRAHGYCFQMHLPGSETSWTAEAEFGGCDPEAPPNPQRAAWRWRCYAWPTEAGLTGRSAFCIDGDGQLFVTDNRAPGYAPQGGAPAANAVQDPTRQSLAPTWRVAGTDGLIWKPD